MKAKICLIFVSLFLLFSCQNNQYTLTGTFTGEYQDALNGKTITVTAYQENNQKQDGVTAIVEDNTFTIKGQPLDNSVAYVTWDGLEGKTFMFIPDKGNIEITIGDDGVKRTGSPANILYQNLLTTMHNKGLGLKKLHTSLEKLSTSGNLSTERFKSIEGDINKIKGEIEALILAFIKDSKNTLLVEHIIVEQHKHISPDKVKELIGGIQTPKDAEKLNKLKTSIENKLNAVSEGKQLSNISGEDVKGKPTNLLDFVGLKNKKLLVVDFWASWCPPCRALSEKLVGLDKKFGKEVTFVGVTLDTDKEAWLKAVKEDKITWGQIATFKPDPITAAYGISEIPYILIVDNKGVIKKAGNFDAAVLEGYIKMYLEEK